MLSWQPFLVRSRLKTRINAAQCRHHNRYHNILKVLSESIVPKLYQNDSKRTKTCSLEICGMLFAALRHCSSLFIRRWMRQRLKAALTMVHTCLLHVLVLISLQVAEQFQLRNFAARVKLWQRFGWSDTATEKELPFFFLQVHPSQDETGPAAMDLLAFECIRAQAGSSRFCGKLVWGPCRRALKCSSHSSLRWWLQS